MTFRPPMRGVALGLVVLLYGIGTAYAATPISYCGQTIRGRGYLTGDLDCTGFIGHAVIIERGRLDLRGFTLRGAGYHGVDCLTSCQVLGPGMITGNGLDGIHAANWVIVRDARVTGNSVSGVYARNINGGSRVVIRDAVITDNGYSGIEADNLAVIRDSTISDNGTNGIDVGLQYCDSGGRALLVRSIATGNGGSCAPDQACADVVTCGRTNPPPRLRNDSLCETSHVRGSGVPGASWGICTQD